jgi:phosphoribosylanthranilate isomerase
MAYLRVKICGLTDEADAVKAAELGAGWIGLNFYKGSPRYITLEKAEAIISALPRDVDVVGIFVSDPSPDAISNLRPYVHLPFHIIQVHGPYQSLPLHLIRAHRHIGAHRALRALHVRWIPAFSVSQKEDLVNIISFLKQCQRRTVDFPGESPSDLAAWMNKPRRKSSEKTPDFFPEAILVDARVPGQFGGTGKTAPWDLLADFKPEVPLILAGGLTPENVAEAVRIVRPYGVDVASGVEISPGRKDPDKMKRFIENAHEAAERLK